MAGLSKMMKLAAGAAGAVVAGDGGPTQIHVAMAIKFMQWCVVSVYQMMVKDSTY